MRRRADITSPRPCSLMPAQLIASRRRKSSGRSKWSFPLRMRQRRLAKALRAGQVFLNNYGAGGGVELPFGGVGKSGHGREKGFEALYGFSASKTVAAWHG